jgi:uncharacterized membrane protein (UPF0136 family)
MVAEYTAPGIFEIGHLSYQKPDNRESLLSGLLYPPPLSFANALKENGQRKGCSRMVTFG